MATILLTGVTGTVGSSLASLLKSGGHQLIYLIRPREGQNPESRLSQVLGKTAGDDVVWGGDVIFPYAGVSDLERKRWNGKIDKVVNCAASIKFDEALAEITTKVNVDGTKNLLELAEELRIPEFHQISTAYVAGDADYFSENDFDIGQTCRNVYEKTKKEAERLVRDWQHGRYSIYRLGIVVGDSVTGYISSFDGYYSFLSSLWRLKQSLAYKCKSEIEEYEAAGISFDSEGILTLRLYFNFPSISTLNIIPIDWAAKTVSDLVGFLANGQVFHIVHPRPQKARWVNDVSLKHLGIKGFCYGDLADYNHRSLLWKLQRIFDKSTFQYFPYITHECRFETTNTPRVLGGKYVCPPDIDEVFIATILDYAKSANFGKKPQLKAVEV